MSRNRFQLLLLMLLFKDNTQQPSTNCSNLDQWWIICLSIFNWCSSRLRMCVLTSLSVMEGAPSFQTIHSDKALSFWCEIVRVRAVVDIFIASEFMLAKTTCFNFQAYHNHRLSFDQLNALCGSRCCQFWRKDLISTWTIITPAFHCLPHFWWPVAEIWPYT